MSRRVLGSLKIKLNCHPDPDLLAGCLLVLPEEVVEDGAVLLVDALHLVYVLGNLQRGTVGQKKVTLLVKKSGQRLRESLF